MLNGDRTVAQRPVRRGAATVDKVQIASGLALGERVITEGADRLRDGSRVVLPGDTPGAGGARGAASGRRGGGPDGAASAPVGGAAAAAAPATPGSGARRRRAEAQ